jgi:hypothetical protein
MLRGKDHRRKIKAAKRIRGKNRTAGKNPLRQTNFKGREKIFTRHRVFYREQTKKGSAALRSYINTEKGIPQQN